MRFFIYDTETCGFSKKAEVIQFSGFLLNDKLQKEEIVNFYAYTQAEIETGAYEAHNIDKKLLWTLSQGKTFEEQIFQFDFLFNDPDIIFIGYNVKYDNRMVNQTLQNNGYPGIDFGKASNTLMKSSGRFHFDLMKSMSAMFNKGISMKLSVAAKYLKKRNLADVNKVFEVIFSNYGVPAHLKQDLAQELNISRFHNSLYDSFLCWCLLLDYKNEINCLFR